LKESDEERATRSHDRDGIYILMLECAAELFLGSSVILLLKAAAAIA